MGNKKIMTQEDDIDLLEEEAEEIQARQTLEDARHFIKSLDFEDLKSGDWFIHLLRKVIQAYDRNANARYFQQKYPGLPPDEIADKLTSVIVRTAAIVGAITGAGVSAAQVTTLVSAGWSAALMVSGIGIEMIGLATIQMRLVLHLSVVYDLQLDPEDPEDVLMIFGYALGVAPTELVGRGMVQAAGFGTKAAIKKYISKDVLKAIQALARRLGIRILQRTIIKYAVPIASAVVGSSYNYLTTQSVGRIAKTHFKNRGQVTDELRKLVSRQNTYDLAFPAATMYLALVDGEFGEKEKEFYRAMLTRMTFDEHTQAQFDKLLASEETIIEAVCQIEDVEIRHSLVEVLALMAIYDGQLVEQEREFLTNVAERLAIPLDLDKLAQRTEDNRIVVEKNILERAAKIAGEATVGAVGFAGQAAAKTRDSVVETSSKFKQTLGEALTRKKTATATCSNCGKELLPEYQFCPSCGKAISTEFLCLSCDKQIPADSAFCPFCGALQATANNNREEEPQ